MTFLCFATPMHMAAGTQTGQTVAAIGEVVLILAGCGPHLKDFERRSADAGNTCQRQSRFPIGPMRVPAR